MASSSNATSDEPSSDQIAGCSFDGARAHTRRTGYFLARAFDVVVRSAGETGIHTTPS